MDELDDNSLLRLYADHNSGEAFATLVARHVNKVYSVALRLTRNPSEAEEVTQAVFVILARKAAGLGRRVILGGWLYQTARLTAVTYLRGEIRRARRQQEAHMQNLLETNQSEVWTQIAPILDAAMANLGEAERNAVLLRFFDGKSVREVGAALGATEGAAEKRLSRGLEKLRRFFFKRGVTSTTATLTDAISRHSVQIAPAALAKAATAAALSKGAAASISSAALVKTTLYAMKIKTITFATAAIVIGAGALLLTQRHGALKATQSPPALLPIHLANDGAKRDKNDPLFIIDVDPSVIRASNSAPAIHIKGPITPPAGVPPGFSDAAFQSAGNSSSMHFHVDKDSPL